MRSFRSSVPGKERREMDGEGWTPVGEKIFRELEKLNKLLAQNRKRKMALMSALLLHGMNSGQSIFRLVHS